MAQKQSQGETTSKIGLSSLVGEYLQDYFDAHQNLMPAPGFYKRFMKEVERPLLLAALQSVAGSQVKAAEMLGINRNTLRKKMQELHIKQKK